MPCRTVLSIWQSLQELGDTTPFVNSNEPGLKRRCIVMLELSATLARVLEFLTSRLPDVFLAGPPLNLSRLGPGAIDLIIDVWTSSQAFRVLGLIDCEKIQCRYTAEAALLRCCCKQSLQERQTTQAFMRWRAAQAAVMLAG